MEMENAFSQFQRSIEELWFCRFVPEQFEALVDFFKEDLQKNKTILLPMIDEIESWHKPGHQKLKKFSQQVPNDILEYWNSSD